MHIIFKNKNTEAALLVVAANAVNSVNREVSLNKIFIICPGTTTYVRNCYIIPSHMFVIKNFEISLSEGTTQGYPTTVANYAIT